LLNRCFSISSFRAFISAAWLSAWILNRSFSASALAAAVVTLSSLICCISASFSSFFLACTSLFDSFRQLSISIAFALFAASSSVNLLSSVSISASASSRSAIAFCSIRLDSVLIALIVSAWCSVAIAQIKAAACSPALIASGGVSIFGVIAWFWLSFHCLRIGLIVEKLPPPNWLRTFSSVGLMPLAAKVSQISS
jgi:hypothetical protein